MKKYLQGNEIFASNKIFAGQPDICRAARYLQGNEIFEWRKIDKATRYLQDSEIFAG